MPKPTKRNWLKAKIWGPDGGSMEFDGSASFGLALCFVSLSEPKRAALLKDLQARHTDLLAKGAPPLESLETSEADALNPLAHEQTK